MLYVSGILLVLIGDNVKLEVFLGSRENYIFSAD